jgi:hypothetical protein
MNEGHNGEIKSYALPVHITLLQGLRLVRRPDHDCIAFGKFLDRNIEAPETPTA